MQVPFQPFQRRGPFFRSLLQWNKHGQQHARKRGMNPGFQYACPQHKPGNKIPTKTKPPVPELKQTQLPIITTEKIMNSLSNDWQTIKDLIWKMKIKDMMDARFLQIKLKELERKEQVIVDVKKGKKYWKLP